MPKKQAVFIGAGAIAREHIIALKSMDNIEIEAVCDLSPARAQSAAERHGIAKWFTDHAEMLKQTNADFVHVTTPPQSHVALARTCLEAGRNVICEKPIAGSYDEFLGLKAIARSKSLLLFENHNYLCHSSVLKIDQMLGSGELGDLVEVQIQVHMDIHGPGSAFMDPNVPHYTARLRGGVVGDFITHMSYLTLHYLGRAEAAQTLWQRRSPDASQPDDEFRALVKGQSGVAYLSFSGNCEPSGFWVKVIGSKGEVEANLFEPPRLAIRRQRGGPKPLATLRDGLAEGRQIASGSLRGLYRKFSGTARYDGLGPFLARCYAALDAPGTASPSIDSIDDSCRLIERLFSEASGK